jgi:predicted acylesterase/phospholipase RssA
MEETASRRAQRPAQACDIIMKGGIASGVFYPRAITEIAESYRLVSIGGASAGAIASTGAAIAEYARGRGRDGFTPLCALIEQLRDEVDGKTLIERLFAPDPGTRALWSVVESVRNVPAVGSAGGRKLSSIMRAGLAPVGPFAGASTVGAAVGALLGGAQGISALGGIRGGGSLMSAAANVGGLLGTGVLVLVGAAVGGWVGFMRSVVKDVPENFIGVVSGHMPDPPNGSPGALTDWLDERFADIAGHDAPRPLTFGHLWVDDPSILDRDVHDPPDGADVNLEIMVTCLNLAAPFRLPRTPMRLFYFLESDFRRLFPDHVVDWMVEAGRAEGARRGHLSTPETNGEPFIPWPHPADIPLIVATRMSLALPGVLSAVPLWAPDFVRPENQRMSAEAPKDKRRLVLERCWFSDGGLASNFPVHLFDAPVPTRPTFALDLRRYSPAQPDQDYDVTDRVERNASPWWRRIDGDGVAPQGGEATTDNLRGTPSLFGFGGLLVDAMKHWQDDALARSPGYRERIVHVHHAANEGGMNLDMPPELIEELAERGRRAARAVMDVFERDENTPGGGVTWTRHRWTRYRATLAALEGFLEQLADGWNRDDVEPPYDALVEDPPNAHRWATDQQRRFASSQTAALLELANRWITELKRDDALSVTREAPQPVSEIRLRPRI